MKNLIRFKYIIAASIFVFFGTLGILLSSQKETYSFIQVLKNSQYDKSFFTDSIDQCKKYCPQSEAQITEAIEKLMSAYLKGEQGREQSYANWIRMYEVALQFYHKRKSVTQLVETYQATLQFLNEFEIIGYKNLSFQKQLHTQILNLPKVYPKSSQIYELVGGLQLIQNAPYEKIIGTYKKCLELDSGNKNCKKFYKRFADFYTQEVCDGSNLSDQFQFFLGSDKKINNFSTEVEYNEDKIYLKQEPILVKNDFAQVKPFDQLNPREGLMISFHETGSEKLFDVTKKNEKKRIVVVLNKQILTAPYIVQGVRQTSVLLDFDDRIKNNLKENVFEEICPKATAKKLPESLVL